MRHLLTLSLILLLTTCGHFIRCENFRQFVNHETYGLVTDKYIDTLNSMRPVLIVERWGDPVKEELIPKYVREVYDSIEVGDELWKLHGTKIFVKRNGRTIEFDIVKDEWCE